MHILGQNAGTSNGVSIDRNGVSVYQVDGLIRDWQQIVLAYKKVVFVSQIRQCQTIPR